HQQHQEQPKLKIKKSKNKNKRHRPKHQEEENAAPSTTQSQTTTTTTTGPLRVSQGSSSGLRGSARGSFSITLATADKDHAGGYSQPAVTVGHSSYATAAAAAAAVHGRGTRGTRGTPVPSKPPPTRSYSPFIVIDPMAPPSERQRFFRGGPLRHPSTTTPPITTHHALPNCMAMRVFRLGPDFVMGLFVGNPSNETHLASYRDLLHQQFRHWRIVACTRSQVQSSRHCIMAPKNLVDPMLKALGLAAIGKSEKWRKYAGLLFNDLGVPIVRVQGVEVRVVGDVERNGFCFTDGCGRVSWAVAEEVWRRQGMARGRNPGPTPSVMQVRAPGVKGVLVVDETLEGRVIEIRKSMKKLNVVSVGAFMAGMGDGPGVGAALEAYLASGKARRVVDESFLDGAGSGI
ncbi:hypothetical protein HDU96_004319, partial [Phlyctochytrium bullatum]